MSPASERCARWCAPPPTSGLEYLTLFAFSSENWKRPRPEVNALMGLFRGYFRSDLDELHARNVRVRIIGSRERVATDIGKMIEEAEHRTVANGGLNLTFAFDYGGQEESPMPRASWPAPPRKAASIPRPSRRSFSLPACSPAACRSRTS